MDKIEKLLRRINLQDRQRLLDTIEKLVVGRRQGLDIVKLKGTGFYRLRTGRFRIIFHYQNSQVIIDSIRIRNENTYREL